MTSNGDDLVSKVTKHRDVAAVQHENIPDVQERLAFWKKFLQEHETPSANDSTHDVFDNYQDWWMGSQPKYRLSIAEDNTVTKLYKCVSDFYDLGIPLTLTERRTSQIRFVQDIEVWGTKALALGVQEFMDTQCSFARLLGSTIGEIYDSESELDLVIFDATGMSKTKGVMKTSIRLVWPKIIVDKERAVKIRDYVVQKFKNSNDEAIRTLGSKMLDNNKDNHWKDIFSDAIYMGRYGIRMPLCDRVSPAPLKKPEERPFKPVGVLRFQYEAGVLKDIEQICTHTDLQGPEWLKIGCIRQAAGCELTEWRLPSYKGERAPRSCNTTSAATTATAMAMSNRAPGQVRVRTNRGSGETYSCRPRRPGSGTGPSPDLPSVTAEREFKGTHQAFQEKLIENLGEDQVGESEKTESDGIFQWRFQSSGLRVDFKESTGRVYVMGKPHQVRAMLSAIAPVVQAIGELARSATTARSAASRGPGSEAGAPSAAYAPSAVYAPSQASQTPSLRATSTSGLAAGRDANGQLLRTRRVVIRDFEAQGTTELALAVDDYVTIDHDPEDGTHNLHRWVYGQNESTQKKGWFPMSSTKPLPQTEDSLDASHQ